jgi:hypothetical protein
MGAREISTKTLTLCYLPVSNPGLSNQSNTIERLGQKDCAFL